MPPPATHRAQRCEQRRVPVGGKRRDELVVGSTHIEQRCGERRSTHLDPPTLVVAGEQPHRAIRERFVDRHRFAFKPLAHRRCDEMDEAHRLLGGDVVEFDSETAEAIAAPATRNRQGHRRACDPAILVADEMLDDRRGAVARCAAGGGN